MELSDIAIVILIAFSTIVGIFRGFFKELALIAVLAIGLLAAFFGASIPDRWIPDEQWQIAGYFIEMQTVGFIVSFVVILLTVLILGRLIVNNLDKLLHESSFSLFNRIFGGVFGLIRGGLIVTIIVTTASLTMFPSSLWWQQSQLIPIFEKIAYRGVQMIPQQYQEYFYLPSIQRHNTDN